MCGISGILSKNTIDTFDVETINAILTIQENRGPDFEMIKNLAVECRMPFWYGGGVTTVEEAKKIILHSRGLSYY